MRNLFKILAKKTLLGKRYKTMNANQKNIVSNVIGFLTIAFLFVSGSYLVDIVDWIPVVMVVWLFGGMWLSNIFKTKTPSWGDFICNFQVYLFGLPAFFILSGFIWTAQKIFK